MLFPLSSAQTDFAKTNKLLYGFPKSGKSTLASTMFDKEGRIPLFIATEDGHNSLSVSRVKVSSWDGFRKCLDFLETNKERLVNEHANIVVDLSSDLDSWCSSHIAKTKNVEYVGDMDAGKGWKLLRDAFGQAMTQLMNLMPVTFVAHTQDKRVMWNGEQVTIQAPSLSKGALDFINGKVDTIMFIVPANSKKEFPDVTMAPTSAWIAGARQRALCRAFRLDPSNPRATYLEIAKVYHDAQTANPVTVQATVPLANNPVAATTTP